MSPALLVVITLIQNPALPVALADGEGLDESARRELRQLLAIEAIRADETKADPEDIQQEVFATDVSKVNRSPAVLGPPTDEPVDFQR